MFSEKLKKILEDRNTTVYKVCKDTGLPLMTVYDWTNNKSKPSAERLYTLAKYLDVSMEELME